MPIRYPVKAEPWERRVGLFDDFGYWASFGGTTFDLSPEHKALAQGIAKAVNAAYEQGRADAREAMRNALGLPQEE